MLDERKTAILSAVVQEYIATAQPVGSTHIADAPGVRVSSATVRNEMAVLEQEGYLVQPHTSAGRIPTDKGYRFFVDHLARRGGSTHARSAGRRLLRTAHGRLEEMLHQHVGPPRPRSPTTPPSSSARRPRRRGGAQRAARARSRPRVATVVVVLGNGGVESEQIEPGRRRDDARLGRGVGPPRRPAHRARPRRRSPSCCRPATTSSTRLCTAGAGGRAQPARRRPRVRRAARRRWRRPSMPSTSCATCCARSSSSTWSCRWSATSSIVACRSPSASSTASSRSSACSVVVAPIVVDGEQRGSVGVLGPTRMNYPQALATVEVVSDRLGRRLGGELTGGRLLRACSGVARNASADEIKRAYRQKARELHPDANPAIPRAGERFKEVARAYEVLSDDDQRARYDRFGEAGVSGAAGGPRIGDVFARRRAQRPVRRVLRRRPEPVRRRRSAGSGRPAARPGHGGRRRPRVRAGGVRGDDPGHPAAAAALRRLRRVGRRRGHAAGHVRRLQRRRPGAAGAPEPARPDGHRGTVPALRRPRPGRSSRRARRAAARVAVTAEHTYQVDVPAGVDTGSTLRLVRSRAGRSSRRWGRRPVRPPPRRPSTIATGVTATTS